MGWDLIWGLFAKFTSQLCSLAFSCPRKIGDILSVDCCTSQSAFGMPHGMCVFFHCGGFFFHWLMWLSGHGLDLLVGTPSFLQSHLPLFQTNNNLPPRARGQMTLQWRVYAPTTGTMSSAIGWWTVLLFRDDFSDLTCNILENLTLSSVIP